MIDVVKLSDEEYEVTVKSVSTSKHRVSLSNSYYRKLTSSKISPEDLLVRSFQFLLERESNTSILSRFDLSVIGKYFPEYEKIISEKMK